MAAQTETVVFTEDKPSRVVRLKVSEGSAIGIGNKLIIFEYQDDEPLDTANNTSNNGSNCNRHQQFIRANSVGVVKKIFVKEGDLLLKNTSILEYTSCQHPVVMKDMCAECGVDLREIEKRNQTAAVAMVHNIPELMVSMEEAQSLGKTDETRLLRDRKLVLLVDLDQTLIHTTNDIIPANIEDVFHFQLHGDTSPWYHTRLRPFTRDFLKNVSELYELHICTFGSRTYAHKIAGFIDEECRYFSHRILSRDECFSAHSKTANLKALFPCGDHMVVIIDDREDVWNYAPNLIHVRPYHFFQHTGDINAPLGLSKVEKDDKEGFDFSSLRTDSEGNLKEDTSSSEETLSASKNPQLEDETITEEADKEIMSEDKVKDMKSSEKDSDLRKDDRECVEPTVVGDQDKKKNQISHEVPEKTVLKKEIPAKTDLSLKVHINDTDDYLLHLQDILRTIHHAYFVMYDDNIKKNESKLPVPDMKCVLPYVRRKVLEKMHIVFSGVVPTNVPLDKSKPYLVAKSLGATVSNKVTEKTTHLIAARLGTTKIFEARKYKHIRMVTPDWLWSCAERWEHVEELLYPLNAEMTVVHRKPPAHCTSPDVALQLVMASSSLEETKGTGSVCDRITDKRTVPPVKKGDKGKSLLSPRLTTERPGRRFSETLNPLLAFSTQDIAEMDREVEDIMQGDANDDDIYDLDAYDVDADDGDSNSDNNSSSQEANDTYIKYDDDDKQPSNIDTDDEIEPHQSSKKRRLSQILDHGLIIGDVSDVNSRENDSILNQFRHGESIPLIEGDCQDDFDDEDSNEPQLDELEPEEEPLDSELCLAGQALEREFCEWSGEED